MPPKRRRKGKGKKGKKKGKKKKVNKVQQDPPPLHLLTELYKKLDEETKMLYEMRIAARRKRIECWFMAREIMNAHNDNDRYRDIVEENMMFLKKAMDKLRKLLEEERDAINKAVQKLIEEYEKKRLEFLRQTGLIEDELANVKQQLLEFQPLMDELARLMERLAELDREIQAAQMDANVKIRHLINQFLNERFKLHNHLEQQLYDLIKHVRSFIMPLLSKFMQDLSNENLCARWKLSHTNDRYIALTDQRDHLIRRRKLLTLEKPYWNIEWSFQKIEEMDQERRRRRKLAREAAKAKIGTTVLWEKKARSRQPSITPSKAAAADKLKPFILSAPNDPHTMTLNVSTKLGQDFNLYLLQKLTAAKAAQERHARARKKEEKRFLEKVLEAAGLEGRKFTYAGEEEGEGEEEEGEEEGEDEDEEREWTERMSKNRKQVAGSFAVMGGSDESDEDEDEGEEEEEIEGEGESGEEEEETEEEDEESDAT